MANIDQAFIDAYQNSHPVSIPLSTFQNSARTQRQAPPLATDEAQATPTSPDALRRLTSGSTEFRADQAVALRETSGPHFASKLDVPSTEYAGTVSAESFATEAAIAQLDAEAESDIVLPPLGKERKPLSTFAPLQPPATEFRPAYEVDAYRWPEMTQQLTEHAHDLLEPLVTRLLHLAEAGRGLVGLTGLNSGAGTTTITLSLAKLLVQTGKQVAIVDANFARGDLATHLDIEFRLGWDQLLAGELPLAECAIKSLADGVTLVPLSGKTEVGLDEVTVIHSAVMAGILRYHHDLVLFDLGASDDTQQATLVEGLCRHCRLDSTLIVTQAEITSPQLSHQLSELQTRLGSSCLGLIGNRA